MEDLYQTLGVSRIATKEEIKKAFRHLARRYHPDTNMGDKLAEEKFKEIHSAYETLMDDYKRGLHDRALDEARKPKKETVYNHPDETLHSEDEFESNDTQKKVEGSGIVVKFFVSILAIFLFFFVWFVQENGENFIKGPKYWISVSDFIETKKPANFRKAVGDLLSYAKNTSTRPLLVSMKVGNEEICRQILSEKSYEYDDLENGALILFSIKYGWTEVTDMLVKQYFVSSYDDVKDFVKKRLKDDIGSNDDAIYLDIAKNIYNPATYAKSLGRKYVVDLLSKKGILPVAHPRVTVDYNRMLALYKKNLKSLNYKSIEEIILETYKDDIIRQYKVKLNQVPRNNVRFIKTEGSRKRMKSILKAQ